MTLTEEEKRQARATDPLAAQIIDRCEQMSPATLAQMHGVLRNPHFPSRDIPEQGNAERGLPDMGLVPELTDDVPWWDPDADTAVRPDIDGVIVNGVRVAKHRRADPSVAPRRRPGPVLRGTARSGGDRARRRRRWHPRRVVLMDDPASELHEWYGRYLYFAPDEVEPVSADTGKEEQS